MNIAIVDYKRGNIQSVTYALNRLGVTPVLTSNKEEIAAADKVLMPGVGEAGSAMRCLQELELDQFIPTLQQPVLGICLGMQLMCSSSEEGQTPCLSIFDTEVKKFPGNELKVPHVGWNSIDQYKGRLWEGLNNNAYVYFVHGYYVALHETTASVCNYMAPFSAALEKDNFYAVQFHPEKSGEVGERILQNFLTL